MTDALKKMAPALGHPHNTAARDDAKDALATLTPGSTWTTDDGVEVMVVPVEATWEMRGRGADEVSGFDRTGKELDKAARVYRAMLSAIRKE